ncbi:hypothetical protein NPD9_2472 [Clostridium botulinum]|nr:hypothetical protein NPD9_2472 [Clostridium botulinum]
MCIKFIKLYKKNENNVKKLSYIIDNVKIYYNLTPEISFENIYPILPK